MVHAVKDMDDFNNQLTAAGGKLVVVDFHATWSVVSISGPTRHCIMSLVLHPLIPGVAPAR